MSTLVKNNLQNPLIWVKPELDKTIKAIHDFLESYSNEMSDSKPLDKISEELHLLRGSLEILEFHGAALLAEDMQKAIKQLNNSEGKTQEDIFEALLQATLSLDTYIDKLHKNPNDIPLTLLPVINDVRASTGEPLLSESALFQPNLSIVPKTPDNIDNSQLPQLEQCAISLRPYYQAALLTWLRNPHDQLSIHQMKLVARNLESTSHGSRNRQIWWVLGGVYEAIADKGLKSNIALRVILSQADRIIKSLAKGDIENFEKNPPTDLLKNALYYISQATSEGERVKTLKHVYQLESLNPSEKDLNLLRQELHSPNSGTLTTIAKELKKSLDQAKATIENHARSAQDKPERLQQTLVPLKHVADTLSLLSFGEEKQLLQNQINIISTALDTNKNPSKDDMLSVASALLQIESALQNIGDLNAPQQNKKPASVKDAQDAQSNHSKDTLSNMEYQMLSKKAANEARANITEVKNNILSYLASNQTQKNIIQNIPSLLTEIKGFLVIFNNQYASDIVSALLGYVNEKMLTNEGEQPTDAELDILAEAIVSFEYYLEAIAEERSPTDHILDITRENLNNLGLSIKAPEQKPKPGIQLEAVVKHINEAPPKLSNKVSTGSATDPKSNVNSNQLDSSNIVAFSPDPADEEVADIFMDEALEELNRMSSYLKSLQLSMNDNDTLLSIRRAYHTLKGSGKIAGAIHISELASTMDELLNRLLCGAIEMSETNLVLLLDSHQFLYKLIDCFKNKSVPSDEFNTLTQTAISLMGPITKSEEPKANRAPAIAENIEPALSDANEFTEDDDIGEVQPLPDNIDQILQSAIVQLNTIDSFVAAQYRTDVEKPSIDVLFAAIKELKNCAESTGVREFIQTTELLAKYISNASKKHDELNAETLDILVEFCSTTREILVDLPYLLSSHELDNESDEVNPESINLEPESANDFQAESEVSLGSLPEVKVDEHFIAESEDTLSSSLPDELPAIENEPTASVIQQEIQDESDNLSLAEDSSFETNFNFDNNISFSEDNLEDDLDLIEIFTEEACELIESGNNIIQEFESNNGDNSANTYAALQRLLHTMKGSARMAGVASVGNFAHALETMVESISSDRKSSPENFVELVQNSFDSINDIVEDIRAGNTVRDYSDLLKEISSASESGKPVNADPTPEIAPETAQETTQKAVADVTIEPLETSEPHKAPDQPENLIADSQENEKDDLTSIPTLAESTTSELLKPQTSLGDNEFPSLPIEAASEILVPDAEIPASETITKQTNELPEDDQIDDSPTEDEVSIAPEANEAIETVETAEAELNLEEKDNDTSEISETAKEKDEADTNPAKKSDPIKVDSSILDVLVDNANEESAINNRIEDHVNSIKSSLLEMDKTVERALVQMRDLQFEAHNLASRTSAKSEQYDMYDELNLSTFSEGQKISQRLMESFADIESLHGIITRLTLETDSLVHQQKKVHAELHEKLLGTRMVTFSVQTQRMQRILRQTCIALRKKAKLTLEGTDGSIDKVLLDTLMGPLEHIIRNAAAHGIEAPGKRKKMKKREAGNVHITFSKQRSEHLIEIEDDGEGIDVDRVRKKAIEKKLIKTSDKLTEQEIINLIFHAGFTTSDSVSQISGRGVGMDVALNEIRQLGGSIAVESNPGLGSKFTIRLPFTVSRNHTLFVKVGKNTYALPSDAIVHTFPIKQPELEQLYLTKSPNYQFEENSFPLWNMEALLNNAPTHLPEKHAEAYIILLKHNKHRLALHVDEINETRDSVLKPANPQMNNIRGIAGATVLGDGKIVLIIDVPSLIQAAESRDNKPKEIVHSSSGQHDVNIIKTLVVDDSITVRKATERFLSRNNIKTYTAKDGIDALEVLESVTPDIMLLDIEMPNMDGLELASRVRANDRLKEIPIVMITSRTGKQHREAASNIGVNVFLGKPFQESELIGYIQALTGKRTNAQV